MQIVFQSQFEKFVIDNYGRSIWECVLKDCSGHQYSQLSRDDDSYLVNLIQKTVEKIDGTIEDILIRFGTYISRIMIAACGGYIKEEWRTLDVLENLEVLRSLIIEKYISRNPRPLRMRVRRVSDTKLEVIYISNVVFAHLGRGIIKGISSYFNEEDQLQVNVNIRKSGTIMIKVNLREQTVFI